jgi:hypothetical protein
VVPAFGGLRPVTAGRTHTSEATPRARSPAPTKRDGPLGGGSPACSSTQSGRARLGLRRGSLRQKIVDEARLAQPRCSRKPRESTVHIGGTVREPPSSCHGPGDGDSRRAAGRGLIASALRNLFKGSGPVPTRNPESSSSG